MKWLKMWKAHVGYAAPGEDPDTVAKGGEAPGQMYLDKLVKVCATIGTVPVKLAVSSMEMW